MRKHILALSLFLGVLSTSVAQNMSSLFVEAPDSVFPLLDKSLRADCIDFLDAGMKYAITNKLDGKSTLLELTADYMLLESTPVSTVQLKKLPMDEDFVICVVNTSVAESADSRVAFFSSSWERLPANRFFSAPSIRDFFSSQSAADELADICDIYLVSLKLDAANTLMVAEYTMPSYMNEEDAEKVTPHLRKISYRWNGAGFVKE